MTCQLFCFATQVIGGGEDNAATLVALHVIPAPSGREGQVGFPVESHVQMRKGVVQLRRRERHRRRRHRRCHRHSHSPSPK